MDARLDIYSNAVAGEFTKHINAASAVITASTLPAATQELVKSAPARSTAAPAASTCTPRMPSTAGESSVRINLIAAWREATVFTEAERAALELTEQGTRVADGGGVYDEAWANAAKHYDDEQLGALVCLIALMNVYNRLNVITRQPGGDYTPGQWG